MENLIVIVHVLAALGVTGLVLIQHGKGADMGASFGSGASQTIFGSVGSGNALTKSTTWLATIFFITSLVLALFAKQQAAQSIQDSFLIENPEQLVQPASEPPAQANPATSDLPVLPAVESQISAEPQAQEAAAESVTTVGPAAVQEQVEETAEDLQNATEN